MQSQFTRIFTHFSVEHIITSTSQDKAYVKPSQDKIKEEILSLKIKINNCYLAKNSGLEVGDKSSLIKLENELKKKEGSLNTLKKMQVDKENSEKNGKKLS